MDGPPFESIPLRLAVGGALLAVLFVAEERWPLRARVEPKLVRWARNLAFIAIGGAALAFTYRPLVLGALARSASADFGLLHRLTLPPWLAVVAAIVLLDATLWVWHVMNHRLPLLWRFHASHHADLDLDASTAVRFHFGELLLSVPYRAGQVALIGVDVGTLFLWETLLLGFTIFHHSNLRLPIAVERALRAAIVTPRLHGIHHSTVARELNSNFGTILTAWDRLLGTFRTGVPQARIQIGLAEIRDPHELGLVRALALSFGRSPAIRPRPWRDDASTAR